MWLSASDHVTLAQVRNSTRAKDSRGQTAGIQMREGVKVGGNNKTSETNPNIVIRAMQTNQRAMWDPPGTIKLTTVWANAMT